MTADNDELTGGAHGDERAPGETAPQVNPEPQPTAEQAAAERAAAQAAAAEAAIAALDAALNARAAPPPAGAADALSEKWPDYLLQWRSGLWVSMREKESNVWKFVAFYATAITLIIGLGQRVTTTARQSGIDLPVDVTTVAAVIGLLTFWGLGIIIDSNFWMSRNLKLVGNIEKLFIPEAEYDRLIPGYYSSPLFRYFRPYSVNFFFLVVLGVVAYLNFVVNFPTDGAGLRQYLLPAMTLIYVGGFHAIQTFDASTREEYFRFYKNAKGKEIAIGSEKLPQEHLEFKTAAAARFQKWALWGAIFVTACYAFRELFITKELWLWWLIAPPLLAVPAHAIASRRLTTLLGRIEPGQQDHRVTWPDLKSQPLMWGMKYERVKKVHSADVFILRWTVFLIAVLLVAVINCPWLRAIVRGWLG